MQTTNRYLQLKSQVACIVSGGVIAEEHAPRKRQTGVDERLVQVIWQEQFLDADNLTTCSKKPVRVINAGIWTGEAGPDFRLAEIEIDGRRLCGDIEIHFDSADWTRHRHDRDVDYNGVVLHAFLNRNDSTACDALQNGGTVERLELAPVLNATLESIRLSMESEDLLTPEHSMMGRCQPGLAQVEPAVLRDFFTQAGRRRMEEKIARVAAQARGETLDQVLYQSIMTAMGYKSSRTLFFLLARRTPIEELKDYLGEVPSSDLAVALESVLLHVASLVAPMPGKSEKRDNDETCSGGPLDAETQDYLNRLHRWWSGLSIYFRDRIIPPTRRWYTGTRPVNFPARRIAGVAQLVACRDFRSGLLERFVRALTDAAARRPATARDFKRELTQLSLIFVDHGNSYWGNRYTLGGKKTPRRMHLIGQDRAAAVLFNALLPVAFLYFRNTGSRETEAFLWQLFENFPSLPENSVTRFMRRRLFGSAEKSCLNFRFEKHNQALFQVFHDCCNNNAVSCDDCTLCRVFEPG